MENRGCGKDCYEDEADKDVAGFDYFRVTDPPILHPNTPNIFILMASLAPDVLSKRVQNINNPNVKIAGDHRSPLLKVIGIVRKDDVFALNKKDEELLEFTSEYYIPFALHPVVPAASAGD
ncbi:hypothetical protein Tco_1186549, partial [Tanacetum coccineum]